MIKTEEALRIVLDNVKQLKNEKINIKYSLNRIIDQDIVARIDIPRFDNSAMDGYAVKYDDIKTASYKKPVSLKISGSVAAGFSTKKKLKSGQAIRIMTGAPIPDGADTVVMFENTRVSGNRVEIFKKTEKGKNIRLRGEDIKRNERIITRGTRLGPAEITVIASLNYRDIKVVRIPRIAFISTGSELVKIGQKLSSGKIPNSNTYTLYSLIQKYNCIPCDFGIVRDDETKIKDKIMSMKDQKPDMILISGGVSIGDYDFVKKVLNSLGFKKLFWRTKMKPGKPLLFGLLKKCPVFGLPGNPPALFTAFEHFVVPAIFKLKGEKIERIVKAAALKTIRKKRGRTMFIPGIVSMKNGRYYVMPRGISRNRPLSNMLGANCFIILSDNVEEIRQGAEVQVQLFSYY